MTISLVEFLWLVVYGAGVVLSGALLYWRFGDWRMAPQTKQGRLLLIAARSALNGVMLATGYFVLGLTLAVTLIYWRHTGNVVWLRRWSDAFVWVLIVMGTLMLLLLVSTIMQRYKLDREVRRQLAEEARQAALREPGWK